MVKLLVEVDVPENIAEFLRNLAALLKKSPEELLTDRLLFDLTTIEDNWELWADYEEILPKYGIIEKKETVVPCNPRSTMLDTATIIKTLEDATDKLSMCFQSMVLQEVLEESPPLKRTIYSAQQSLVELKQEIEESKEART